MNHTTAARKDDARRDGEHSKEWLTSMIGGRQALTMRVELTHDALRRYL